MEHLKFMNVMSYVFHPKEIRCLLCFVFLHFCTNALHLERYIFFLKGQRNCSRQNSNLDQVDWHKYPSGQRIRTTPYAELEMASWWSEGQVLHHDTQTGQGQDGRSLVVCNYYSRCGDVNQFTRSRCGHLASLWGQNASQRNVNHWILGWRLGSRLG